MPQELPNYSRYYLSQMLDQSKRPPIYSAGQGAIRALGDIGTQYFKNRSEQDADEKYNTALAEALQPQPVGDVAITPKVQNPDDVQMRAMTGQYNQPAEMDLMSKLLASPNADLRREIMPVAIKAQAEAAQRNQVTPYQEAGLQLQLEGLKSASEDRRFGYDMTRENQGLDRQLRREIASESNALRRELAPRTGGDERTPPSGFRWNPDKTGLEPIPGGPADPNSKIRPPRPIGQSIVKELADTGSQVQDFDRLSGNFKADFGGNWMFGDWENAARRMTGDPSGQAQWWQDYQSQLNLMRNKLFGSALTPQEKSEFEKAVITPGMAPAEIQKNLARQKASAGRAAKKLANAYSAAGYDKEAIEGALGMSLEEVRGLDTSGMLPKGGGVVAPTGGAGGWSVRKVQ